MLIPCIAADGQQFESKLRLLAKRCQGHRESSWMMEGEPPLYFSSTVLPLCSVIIRREADTAPPARFTPLSTWCSVRGIN